MSIGVIKYEPDTLPEFPFEFMRAKGTNRTPQFLHWHEYLELDLVLGGSGINYIAGREYRLEPGQLYLINELDHHIAVTDSLLEMLIILFHPNLFDREGMMKWEFLRPFYPVGPEPSKLAGINADEFARISGLFSDIEREWRDKKPGCQLMMYARLSEILAIIYRAGHDDGRFGNPALLKNFAKLEPGLRLINARFREPLGIDEICSACHMSRTYFSSLFSQTHGITCSEYIERLRISNACMLLITTGRAVVDIALESGFSSLSTFNSAFKKHCGKTPSQYRSDAATI